MLGAYFFADLNLHRCIQMSSLNKFEILVDSNEKTIVLTIVSNRTILDDELSVYDESRDEVDVLILDKLVQEFNKLANGLILDYNYEILDKQNILLKVLMKPMFSKFGEVQRFVTYKINYNADKQYVTANKTNQPISLKIPSSCLHAPFQKITMTNTKEGDINTTVIHVSADELVSSYKNFDMIMSFTKMLIHKNYQHIDEYIKICKSK